MSVNGLHYFEQHFLLSNRLVQFIIGMNCNNSMEQFISAFTLSINAIPVITYELRLVVAHLKFDYENMTDEEEVNIMQKYLKKKQNLFKLDNTELILPLPMKSISSGGFVYFSMLIYQIIGIDLALILSSIICSVLMVFANHARCQFSVITLKIRQRFMKEQPNNVVKKIGYKNASEDEYDWMIDLIKRYKRATELV
ncbi:hypothetical protein M0802_009719 [Mischocyttarus mexicanus]|nr:hypothetical protein M0802_009719 [Mischocyttarus mexicanus]